MREEDLLRELTYEDFDEPSVTARLFLWLSLVEEVLLLATLLPVVVC